MATANDLRRLRTEHGIPAKDMADEIRRLYPKFDKTVLSKCEHGDEYGVVIKDDALAAVYAKFAPGALEPSKATRHGKHRLTCRVSARLDGELYAALQQQMRADGYATTQDLLADLVRRYIETRSLTI